MDFYLGKGTISLSQIPCGNFLLIHDNWDDWFTYETQNTVYYKDHSGEKKLIGQIKIGQYDQKTRSAVFPAHFTHLPDNCFSLGQSEEYYENIRTILDETERESYFKALNDIAYDLGILKKVKGLDVTKVSLMRSVSAFTIEHQFHSIAHGGARLTPYDIEYTYPSEKTDSPAELSFRVEPDSYPPTNIHVLIGRNNVGKTFLLKHMILSAYDYTPNKLQHGVLRSTNSRTGKLSTSRKQAFANILFISFSPFDDYSDICKLGSNKDSHMPFSLIEIKGVDENDFIPRLIKNLKECQGTDEKIKRLESALCILENNPTGVDENDFSSRFIKSLKECQSNRKKMKLLESALCVLETDPIFERSQLNSLIELPCNGSKSEESKKIISNTFSKLSSGHQVIMLSLIELIERITERTLVVLDEPENHLHPPLLSAFIRAISQLLIDQNGVAIIATHSPVILQEVPRSCVWKINRSGTEVAVSRLQIESFGATIGALTHEVFGLEVNKSGFHKMLIDEVESGKSFDMLY